jgi:hypothetical protein
VQIGPIGHVVGGRGAGGDAPGVVGVTLNPLTIASVASAVAVAPWVVAVYVTDNDTR